MDMGLGLVETLETSVTAFTGQKQSPPSLIYTIFKNIREYIAVLYPTVHHAHFLLSLQVL